MSVMRIELNTRKQEIVSGLVSDVTTRVPSIKQKLIAKPLPENTRYQKGIIGVKDKGN